MRLKMMIHIIVILLLMSCNKEESELWTEVHVKATDFNTGESLSDIYISVIEWDERIVCFT